MYAPYPENMMESIKKVEATRAERMATEPRRLSADEKDALLKKFHPDYNPDAFAEIKVGPNKGQKAPLELTKMLHSESRLLNEKIDLTKIDYDVDVLIIGGGGAGSSCAIEAHNAGANVMIVTKLRIGDANTMMAEGGIQAADKENDSPVQHYLDCFGGGHFAAKPELVKRLVMEAPDAIKWLNDLGVEFDKADILEELLPQVIDRDKEKLVEFLSAIDTGIQDIFYDDSEKNMKFYTFHKGKDGEEYPLSLYFESEGTIKSIMLFIYARLAVLNGGSIFVDELNIKLHPLLLKFITDLFYDEKSLAQLIYTTHDTTLMDKKFFRRDQIWFVQKDEFGYSELSALSDFKIRSDASFEKDYLAGVYGGIPYIKDFDLKEGE